MSFIEAPTTFYLGRGYDPATHSLRDEVVYYDSRDLTTHAVVVGMTGSGKTGLCIDLLEEAVLDNIPAIVIDPKGDITNLLLAFPNLQPEDFAPWLNSDDARRGGVGIDDYSREVAQQWRDGLASWGIGPGRIGAFKNAAQFSIYTPGSDAGLPISILDSLRAPREGWAGFEEGHRERISGIVIALLALIGKQVEPVRDREHILLSNIFENAWKNGQDLSLEDIITRVQKPPFARLGVFDVDTFFPEKDRFKLAMDLNNIIASPSFQTWLSGESLDIGHLFYTPEGRARVSIFYIAHLTDAERTFIITLLLENMLAWMRTQSGTSSLRGLLYFDVVFGAFPPYPRNPPTKEPLLRLLKQARAFGIGLILATQNPGDLDYKSLSNAGTWFIGKLQTENDKSRVLGGLQATSTAETKINFEDISRLISGLDPRVFLVHNVHDKGGPMLMHSRWTMSYLRGSLTRQEVHTLMDSQRKALGIPSPQSLTGTPSPAQAVGAPAVTAAPAAVPEALALAQPNAPFVLPPPAPIPDAESSFPGSLSAPQNPAVSPAPGPAQPTVKENTPTMPDGYTERPVDLPSSVSQYYLPVSISVEQAIRDWEKKFGYEATAVSGARLLYKPVLIVQLSVRYLDRKKGVDQEQRWAFHVPNVEKSGLVDWSECQATPINPDLVSATPAPEAYFGPLTQGLTDPKRMSALKTEAVDFVYRTAALTIFYSPTLDIYGAPGDSRRDFILKIQQKAREARDHEIDVTATKFDSELEKMERTLRGDIRNLSFDKEMLNQSSQENLYTTGEAMLSLLKGRTNRTLSRMSRSGRFKMQARERSVEAGYAVSELENQLDRKRMELQQILKEINDKWAKIAVSVEEIKLTAYKKDVTVELSGIGWLANWYVMFNGQRVMLPGSIVYRTR